MHVKCSFLCSDIEGIVGIPKQMIYTIYVVLLVDSVFVVE